mmetsp:Transcript_88837/g.281160  ORF Transcript_88837/g.281160 Transcript_88837/m.281160 type:complete len:238 (+) Transcript_88837:605-1318(+)
MDMPLRAPKRYCPARPPAPWQEGMPPNQHPRRFIRPTEEATLTRVAPRPPSSGLPKRSVESAHTEMTLLSVVSGSCGSAPSRRPSSHSCPCGTVSGNSSAPKASLAPSLFTLMTVRTSPMAKTRRAVGSLVLSISASVRRKHARHVSLLSTPSSHPCLCQYPQPCAAMRTPRPTCMPAMTHRGIALLARSMVCVSPSSSTARPVRMPAAAKAPGESPSLMATAAMDFMGCTGMGMSH